MDDKKAFASSLNNGSFRFFSDPLEKGCQAEAPQVAAYGDAAG